MLLAGKRDGHLSVPLRFRLPAQTVAGAHRREADGLWRAYSRPLQGRPVSDEALSVGARGEQLTHMSRSARRPSQVVADAGDGTPTPGSGATCRLYCEGMRDYRDRPR